MDTRNISINTQQKEIQTEKWILKTSMDTSFY